MIQVIHHRIKCIGCGVCVQEAPDYWLINEDDGLSLLINAHDNKGFHINMFDDEFSEEHDMAADMCPVNCIEVKRLGK